ncbi:hypothetical protein [Dehalococcoides sp. THU4]|uniref:hypothetical protein n=1 Tax=Dehalococcoides sp. THU4 TaxID=3348344 RepID=UPI00371BDA2B
MINEIARNTFEYTTKCGDKYVVGDKDSFDCRPHIQMNRWEGWPDKRSLIAEYPIATTLSNPIIDGSKIRIETNSYAYLIYDAPDAGDEGGVEFEIILLKRLSANCFPVPMDLTGLNVYLQPPLNLEIKDPAWDLVTETQAFDAKGNLLCERPKDIVWSLAVYHDNKGGKLYKGEPYKSGKAFHIKRPIAFDDKGLICLGKWVFLYGYWCCEFDKEWLASATYPIRIDPTFGYETAGSSSQQGPAGAVLGSLFTSPSGTSMGESITVSTSSTGGYPFKGLLIAHTNLSVVNNGVGNEVSSAYSKSWKTSAFGTPPIIASETPYVLSIINKNAYNAAFYYDTGVTDQGHYDSSNSYDSPTSLGTITHSTNKFSIYCTYSQGIFQINVGGILGSSGILSDQKRIFLAIGGGTVIPQSSLATVRKFIQFVGDGIVRLASSLAKIKTIKMLVGSGLLAASSGLNTIRKIFLLIGGRVSSSGYIRKAKGQSKFLGGIVSLRLLVNGFREKGNHADFKQKGD